MHKKQLEKITAQVLNEFSLENALTNVMKFFQNDRRFSYSEMIKTPGEIERQLKEMGLKTEVFNLKSNGKTAYLDCTLPQLWDVKDAGLEILSPEKEKRVIADYSKCKLVVPNRCKETKKGGITGELLLESELGKKSAKGKFVLSFNSPSSAKAKAIGAGAAAMVSAYSESGGTVGDGIFWANGWSQSTGWYHSKEEPRITTFMISYNEGKRLEKLLIAGKKVKLKGFVDARTFDGNLKAVSTVIPGESKQELLFIGHMYEPFPSDNCDGNAAMLETARIITKLLKEKKIPKPKRSLRFLFSMEKYGAGHYFTNEKRSDRIFAAINLDSISHAAEFTNLPLNKNFSPCSQPSIIDAVLDKAAKTYLPENKILDERGTFSDDCFMSDPAIGIPSCWLWTPSGLKHHNSVITFSASDWNLYKKVCSAIIAFALELLYLDDGLAREFMSGYTKTLRSFSRAEYSALKKRVKSLTTGQLAANFDFIAEWNKGRLESLLKLGINNKIVHRAVKELEVSGRKAKINGLLHFKSSSGKEYRPELFELERITPERLTKGMPFDQTKVPFKLRRHAPGATDRLFAWMDGKKTLRECIELYEMDIEKPLSREAMEKTLDYVAFLAKWKYLKLKTA